MAIVTEALGKNARDWSATHKRSVESQSLVLAMIPDLKSWSSEQKGLATRIIDAKAGNDEALYLKLMQKHAAFRDALMRLGCR